jgi:vitamin-K-epoxide reductase (warfarin-sensitive)
MRYLVAILALAGLIVSCFALREHFRTEPSPCSINDRWDCGAVNHSPFAEIAGVISVVSPSASAFVVSHSPFAEFARVPVAVFGMLGYAAIAGFALARRWGIVLLLTTGAVGFSILLTYIEARILETYCIWCVISAGIIALTEIVTIVAVIREN